MPSSTVVKEIAAFVNSSDSDLLIKAWCASTFPRYESLFDVQQLENSDEVRRAEPGLIKQKELTLRQVGLVTKSFRHYQVFLMLTLSRKRLAIRDIKEMFDESIDSVIDDLCEAKVAVVSGEKIYQVDIEMRFPKASTDELKAVFAKVESWNKKIGNEMHFEKVKEKFFIRRTSMRHIELITGFLSQMDSLIRVADDMDINLNNEVVSFEYSLSRGKIPG